MSYSIEHNILDPNLYVKHQGLPHELYDLWREQDRCIGIRQHRTTKPQALTRA